jgi:hypothetical protein
MHDGIAFMSARSTDFCAEPTCSILLCTMHAHLNAARCVFVWLHVVSTGPPIPEPVHTPSHRRQAYRDAAAGSGGLPSLRCSPAEALSVSDLHVQTMKGTKAKGPTRDEIRHLLMQASAKLAEHPRWPRGWKPIWSMDNVSMHVAAAEDWHGAWRVNEDGSEAVMGEILFVPPYSPDLHQVIEHVHANTCGMWKRELMHLPFESKVYATVVEVFEHLQECFYKANTTGTVSANIRKVYMETYLAVLALDGGWPPAKLR